MVPASVFALRASAVSIPYRLATNFFKDFDVFYLSAVSIPYRLATNDLIYLHFAALLSLFQSLIG